MVFLLYECEKPFYLCTDKFIHPKIKTRSSLIHLHVSNLSEVNPDHCFQYNKDWGRQAPQMTKMHHKSIQTNQTHIIATAL